MLVSFMVEFVVNIPDEEFMEDKTTELAQKAINYLEDHWLDLIDVADNAELIMT